MRWWLAGAFVAVAALTAALIATVTSRQTDRAVTANARNLAIGESVSAGFALGRSADLAATARAFIGWSQEMSDAALEDMVSELEAMVARVPIKLAVEV